MNNIYTLNHTNIIEFILLKKRIELCEIINLFLKDYEIYDALDIGTTDDNNSESSNFLIKNLKNISKYKSISDQVIKNQMFDKILNKSIIDDFSLMERNRQEKVSRGNLLSEINVISERAKVETELQDIDLYKLLVVFKNDSFSKFLEAFGHGVASISHPACA